MKVLDFNEDDLAKKVLAERDPLKALHMLEPFIDLCKILTKHSKNPEQHPKTKAIAELKIDYTNPEKQLAEIFAILGWTDNNK